MGKFDGWLLLSDLDGTLTYETGKISKENTEALQYFMDHGGRFGIATGRFPDFIQSFSIKPNAPCIHLNGAMICIDGNEISANPFTEDNRAIIEEGLAFLGEVQEVRVCSEKGTLLYGKDDHSGQTVYKYVFVAKNNADAKRLCRYLSEKYGSQFEIFMSWDLSVEVLQKGSTKGNCANTIKQRVGATKLCCVGDYENDISMLEVADLAVVPADCPAHVQAHAHVVGPAHTEHIIPFILKQIES